MVQVAERRLTCGTTSRATVRGSITTTTHPAVTATRTELARSSVGPKQEYDAQPSEFIVRVTRAYREWLAANGQPRGGSVPDDVRAAIRTAVGTETFQELHGRLPRDGRELASHLVQMSRPRRQAVAGFDVTFSPVKSVSALWALAPREISEQIEGAHRRAVENTIAWVEREVAYTRRGADGIRQVDVRGLLATAFVHRDSRAGDPDLHTHVAISNKVQTLDGAWLALDGQMLYPRHGRRVGAVQHPAGAGCRRGAGRHVRGPT